MVLAERYSAASIAGGFSTLALALAAVVGGTAGMGDWRARQRAQKALADEQVHELRLDRVRALQGWSPAGLRRYGVRLVTDPGELTKAADELSEVQPSAYVVLAVEEFGRLNVNRADSLRKLIANTGELAEAPTAAEIEALEAGREVLAARAGQA